MSDEIRLGFLMLLSLQALILSKLLEDEWVGRVWSLFSLVGVVSVIVLFVRG